ncbi:LOB domain-containing protein 25-like [Musa acuminata AAA Group]|uniref:(wild Malaysian banana) hypothetical protein n=1 Tax=Musa acuminata subsp. malaccensis TaxID=214687 RepID=A0A804IX94_MUSAM|nr:PREDICTED: LOB domain-containing protein 25-like [Musa acuminata subsp. malaccensis]CAG1844279.1 unnamed protein product [Musa acuminata subsp. malaccensis]
MSAASRSPCAACRFLRRKCTPGCVFAPYFPPDQPTKFTSVHRVFGASNVAKLLGELSPWQREDAVNSLAYEAEARLHDPVYGCVGHICLLQHKLHQVQSDLYNARKELSAYLSVPIADPHHQQPQAASPSSHQQILLHELQQQMAAVQQIAANRERANQQEISRFSTVFQMAGGSTMAATTGLPALLPPRPFEGVFSPQQQHNERK